MPNFTSSAAELRALAKAWNEGKRAYRGLFEDVPQEGRSSMIRLRPSPPTEFSEALEACNEQWVPQEARRQTRDEARVIRQRIAGGLPPEQIKSLRSQLRRKRSELAAQLVAKGSLAGTVNTAQKQKDVSYAKNYLVLCLGAYLTSSEGEL